MAVKPSLPVVLAEWQRDTMEQTRTTMPAQVVAYDETQRRATLTLVLRGADAVGTPAVPVPLYNVPVLWLRYGPIGAKMTVRGRLYPGDEVAVSICDRAIDRWLATGGIVDLESDRTHALIDAIALPGLSSSREPAPVLAGLPSLLVGREDGSAALTIADNGTMATLEAPLVRLGALATEPAVLGAQLAEALTTFATAVATANTTWAGNPVTAPTFSTALGTALGVLLGAIPDTLSTKVMVEP